MMQTPPTIVSEQTLPIIDLSEFLTSKESHSKLAKQLHQACRTHGFFYVVGHGVSEALQERLEHLSQQFFMLPLEQKMSIRMSLGGKAWRGFFPLGDELTSGKPDLKEGLYFGAELGMDHPKVRSGTPLHGHNLFPEIAGFRDTVLRYIDELTRLGHTLLRLLSLSLELPEDFFEQNYTQDPLILFRIFHYPPDLRLQGGWGVGEHTDYGLLTILKQDSAGGLQVKSQSSWIEAVPIAGSFVCNIGDMLDRVTGGLYRSTPHRVRNVSGRDRYSFPLFFDPGFDTELKAIPHRFGEQVDDHHQRWDQASVHEFQGTYGDYILAKVAKVFPELSKA